MSSTEKQNDELLRRRDVANFIQIRNARPSDDQVVGDLLVTTFRDTYAQKLPNLVTGAERERELRDVCSRREHGLVRVLELGYRVIGTFALMPPESKLSDAWTPDTATLRCLAIDRGFHQLRLSDAMVVDAIGLARAWKASAICLHVQEGAEGVARLYGRHGFVRAPEGDKLVHGNLILGYRLNLELRFHALPA